MGCNQGGGDDSEARKAGGYTQRPERWSAQRKTKLVLRLLRGEALDAVSQESQVLARELECRGRKRLGSRAEQGRARLSPSNAPGPGGIPQKLGPALLTGTHARGEPDLTGAAAPTTR